MNLSNLFKHARSLLVINANSKRIPSFCICLTGAIRIEMTEASLHIFHFFLLLLFMKKKTVTVIKLQTILEVSVGKKKKKCILFKTVFSSIHEEFTFTKVKAFLS